MLKLSELPLGKINLVRDGSFSAMALCDARIGVDTFVYFDQKKYLNIIAKNPTVTCVICPEALAAELPDFVKGVCVSEMPKEDFFSLHNELCETKEYPREEFETIIGENCQVSELAYIEGKNVIIGNNVRIEEFVSIKANTTVGNNVTIRAGSIIGCDGVEVKRLGEELFFVTHAGGVVLGNGVNICSNTSISRAVFPWDNTVIEDFTVIGNNSHIGHCSKIGKRNIITASVDICGSVISEEDVYIGPNATIGKVILGKDSRVSLGAVVIENVKPSATVSGNFAVEHMKQLLHTAKIKNSYGK